MAEVLTRSMVSIYAEALFEDGDDPTMAKKFEYSRDPDDLRPCMTGRNLFVAVSTDAPAQPSVEPLAWLFEPDGVVGTKVVKPK